jgi:hypothetical protein
VTVIAQPGFRYPTNVAASDGVQKTSSGGTDTFSLNINGLVTKGVEPSPSTLFFPVYSTGDSTNYKFSLANLLASTIPDGDKGDISVSGTGTVWSIDSGVVTNTKLAQMAGYTLKGNASGSTGDAQDLSAGAVLSTLAFPIINGFRLTLTSGTPVLSANVSAASTIIYTPYLHQYATVTSDGSRFYIANIGNELSQTLSDNTKSPAAAVANSVYDMFLWLDAGTTWRCTRGPAWSSATSRGAGAGTSELTRTQGFLVNAQAITNGPAASRGIYVGSIATDAGGATVSFHRGGLGASGTEAILGVWNMYNRIDVCAMVRDSTNSWTYSTASFRSANNSTTNRITYVQGWAEDDLTACYSCPCISGASSNYASVGIGVDSTSATSGSIGTQGDNVTPQSFSAHYMGNPGIGRHYFQALEYSSSGASTFFGDAGTSFFQNGLFASMRA